MKTRNYSSLSDSELKSAIENIENEIRLKKRKLSEIEEDIETLLKYQEYLINELEGET
jgi:enoyl reductase-like protein